MHVTVQSLHSVFIRKYLGNILSLCSFCTLLLSALYLASRSLSHGKRDNRDETREEEKRRRRTKEDQKTCVLFPRPDANVGHVPSHSAYRCILWKRDNQKKEERVEEVSGKNTKTREDVPVRCACPPVTTCVAVVVVPVPLRFPRPVPPCSDPPPVLYSTGSCS